MLTTLPVTFSKPTEPKRQVRLLPIRFDVADASKLAPLLHVMLTYLKRWRQNREHCIETAPYQSESHRFIIIIIIIIIIINTRR
jgi:hypothetical protein